MALLRKDDLERAERGMSDFGAVLERGEVFRGVLAFETAARVEGHLEGGIRSGGRISIGPDATVSGKVRVGSAWVAGTLGGRIHVEETLELTETARVSGVMVVGALVSEKGAAVEAEVQISGVS